MRVGDTERNHRFSKASKKNLKNAASDGLAASGDKIPDKKRQIPARRKDGAFYNSDWNFTTQKSRAGKWWSQAKEFSPPFDGG